MIMPFGKHRGKTIEAIADDDLNYLGWLLTITLNPILYMEVARVYADRTGYTGEIPLPMPFAESERASESRPPSRFFDDCDYFGDDTPSIPIHRKTITLTSDDQIDLHLLLRKIVPHDKIEPLALAVLNRILHGPQLSTSKSCLRQFAASYGVDMSAVLEKLVAAGWISYGETMRPGPSAYRIITMGTRAAEVISKVL